MFRMIFLVGILLLSTVGLSVGLVGYDCTNKPTNLTAVSLGSVTPCPIDTPPLNEERVVIQLVQEKNIDHVSLIACLVERSYLITHCGMHSHASMGSGGFQIQDIMRITREVCQTMHSHGSYTVLNGQYIMGLKVNTTKVVTVVEMGMVTPGTSACEGTSFTVNGMPYSNAVMTSSYKFKLVQERARLDISTGTVRTSSSYSFDFHGREGFDPDLGFMFWETAGLGEKCSRTSHVVVYEGPASIFVSSSGTRTLVVNTTDQVMAVGVRTPTLLCHQAAIETDHPRLFIMTKIVAVGGFYFTKSTLDSDEVDLFLYTNSKLVYVEQHLAKAMTAVFQHFHHRMCETQHQLLNQLTTLAFISPEEFAWSYLKRPGVTGITRGEVVYLMECEPVSVSFREVVKCYQEIPVTHEGRLGFLKPRSRIITSYGSEIECSPLAPPMYNTKGGWVSFNPGPTVVEPPVILTAAPSQTWAYTSVPRLVSAGIYSQSTLKEYQRQLMFPIERAAIEHTSASVMSGRHVATQQLDAGLLMGHTSFESLSNSFMSRMYGWWWSFSVNLAGVVGVLYLITAIKALAGMVLNGAMLYKTFGFSLKLLAMLWGTLAKYFLVFAYQKKETPPASPDVEAPPDTTAPLLACPRSEPQMVMYPNPVMSAPTLTTPTQGVASTGMYVSAT
uniref:Hypthetical protein 2 n=1 Tax=Umea virus TaxID=2739775 RepID=A0A859D179_9MONO|nr:hypthetical protein 2 [Umea virus]